MKFVLRYPVYAVVALSTLCATLPITPSASAATSNEAGGKKTGPVQRLIKSKKFQTLLKKVQKQGSLSKINALIKNALGDDSDLNREILKNVISSLDDKGKFTKSQLKALKSDINNYIKNGGNTPAPTPPPTPPPGPTPPPESPTQST